MPNKHVTIKHFKQATTRATEPLKLIHSNLNNYIAILIFFNYEYYIIFIDNFFNYTILRLLQYKNKCLLAFKFFFTWVEIQIGNKNKTLHFDQGKKYLSFEFNQYLEIHKI